MKDSRDGCCQMETKSVSCLTNSISRFIHLVSCQTSKSIPTQEDFEHIANVVKHFKIVLDEIVDGKVSPDEIVLNESEKLDSAVNEAREFVERWSPKMSRIFTVFQSELLLTRIRNSSLEICLLLCRSLRMKQSSSSLAGVQHCMQELQCWRSVRISTLIEQVLKSRSDKCIPGPEHISDIIEFLGLTSNLELLKESIAVEKEQLRARSDKSEGLDQMSQMVDLVSILRDYMLKSRYFDAKDAVPVPSYFRCPLSLDLMLDPVIVASGQTFERASIQRWLDNGLNICPSTRQCLSHTNLIPNYTIKALISNWCEENNLKPSGASDSSDLLAVPSLSNHVSTHDVIRTDSFCCSQHSSDSTSRFSPGTGDVCGRQKIDEPDGFGEIDSSACQSNKNEKSEHLSTENSYIHSRSQSASSAISSCGEYVPTATEMSRISLKHEKGLNVSGEITSECSNPRLLGRRSQSSRTSDVVVDNRSSNYPRTISFPSPDLGCNGPTTSSYVGKLVEDLQSQSNKVQTAAAAELRLLTKHNNANRIIVGQSGVIGPLISLLHSEVKITQEHAVTALLNLSINEENKAMIAETGAIDPLIHVLKLGNDAAKENSAATLFSLSILEEYKVKIGHSGAVKPLVDLLGSGTVRGKKDAATALFNLSICHQNIARIVQAGAVKHLVQFLDPDSGMVDKAVALLANLSTIAEGRSAIVGEGGIPLIVEIVETGSQRGKENAASVLLQLCLNSNKFCCMVLQEGAVPPLVALSQSGTPRAKEKAHQLLSHFRSQREGAAGNKNRK
ncbi:hypothetical protein Ancab_020296 [Ancistrocladus abbreviatus]